MSIFMLEKRIQRLEKLLYRHTSSKNEFLKLGEPKRSDESPFVEKLFGKYPTISKTLSYEDIPTKNTSNDTFHLVLSSDSKYNNIRFVIQGPDRSNMSCTAFDSNDLKIDALKQFSLDTDVNTVARFILETLRSNKKQHNEKRASKVESVSLSGMDCESIRKYINDSLSKKYDTDVDVEVDTKYANLGIVVISIYNNSFITDYTITANNTDNFKADYNGKTIISSSTLNRVEDYIINHFIDAYDTK